MPKTNQPNEAYELVNRHYRRCNSSQSRTWRFHNPSHPTNLDAFIACMEEIALAYRSMTEFMAKEDRLAREGGWSIAQTTARLMSVSIRKLCLQNQGAILKRAIDGPTFHPLGGVKGKYRQVSMTWTARPQEWGLEFEDGRKETVTIPDRSFEIQVGRLYGVVFLGDKTCAIHSPFDFATDRIGLDAWLNLKALQINSVSYTVCDLITLVANAEGAHNTDALPALISKGVNPEDIGTRTRMKYSLTTAVRFGFFTYPQIIVFFTGLYLISRVQEILQVIQASGETTSNRTFERLKLQTSGLNTCYFAQVPLQKNVYELFINGNLDGSRGRRVRRIPYHVWSGSDHWDAPTIGT